VPDFTVYSSRVTMADALIGSVDVAAIDDDQAVA